MRDRLPLLLIAGLLLLGAVSTSLFRAAGRGAFADRLSTYRSDQEGARALYVLAEESGISVARHTSNLEIMDGRANLILLGLNAEADDSSPAFQSPGKDAGTDEPRERHQDQDSRGLANLLRSQNLSGDEVQVVLAQVRKGRTLIYAPWTRDGDKLLATAGVKLGEVGQEIPLRTVVPAQPSAFTVGVERLETPVRSFLQLSGEAVPILLDDVTGEVVASVTRHGTGRIIVLGAPALAMNESLSRADNAQFWLSLLKAAAGRGQAVFDEFHHGFTNDRSIVQFAVRYRLHFALGQLLLGLCAWAASLRRFGRPVPPLEAQRTSAIDALSATSRLYREGKHHAHASQLILTGLLHELGPMAGERGQLDPTAMGQRLTARGLPALAVGLRQVASLARGTTSEGDVQQTAIAATKVRQQMQPTAGRRTGR